MTGGKQGTKRTRVLLHGHGVSDRPKLTYKQNRVFLSLTSSVLLCNYFTTTISTTTSYTNTPLSTYFPDLSHSLLSSIQFLPCPSSAPLSAILHHQITSSALRWTSSSHLSLSFSNLSFVCASYFPQDQLTTYHQTKAVFQKKLQ